MDHLSSTIIMCTILLLFYASGTVKGQNFDDDCNDDDVCTETNTVCSIESCACSMSTFRNTTEACVNKVALEAECAANQPADQCADNLAECKDGSELKCLCKAANYKSSSGCKVKVNINASCDIADMATDQCSVGNTTCSDDGNGMKKCLCTSAYYESGSTCHDRKKPDEACASDQCVANAMCSATNNTCACNAGYKATPTSTPSSCEGSDATIIIAPIYVFIFGIVASLYLLV